ncbi:MAG: hypothetical protein H7318_06165 [Oligoflexus sp.]|nr:hypothetical protein [Oligoflexus sp.]
MQHSNKLLSAFEPDQLKAGSIHLKPLPALFIRPSRDLGKIEMDQFARFPFPLRHLLRGLGITDYRAWDLLSYLAFEKDYANALLDLGYQDGLAQKVEIRSFLNGD